MNRIQFFVLTGLSSLIVLLLIGHIFLVRQANLYQSSLNEVQQAITQGQASKSMFLQVAQIIATESAKDNSLKELMSRQQISFTPNTNSVSPPASAPGSGSYPASAPPAAVH